MVAADIAVAVEAELSGMWLVRCPSVGRLDIIVLDDVPLLPLLLLLLILLIGAVLFEPGREEQEVLFDVGGADLGGAGAGGN